MPKKSSKQAQLTLIDETPFDETPMPFGKYKGTLVKDLDPSYILMLIKDKEFISKLKTYVLSPEFTKHITRSVKG